MFKVHLVGRTDWTFYVYDRQCIENVYYVMVIVEGREVWLTEDKVDRCGRRWAIDLDSVFDDVDVAKLVEEAEGAFAALEALLAA